jgi:hypothetical protein
MAGTLKFDTWVNDNGSENYKCRAWVNFNGTGTVAIRASGNVSSITDNGVGDYTVSFTTAMPDVNYAIAAAASIDATSAAIASDTGVATHLTGSVRVLIVNNAGSVIDRASLSVTAFR